MGKKKKIKDPRKAFDYIVDKFIDLLDDLHDDRRLSKFTEEERSNLFANAVCKVHHEIHGPHPSSIIDFIRSMAGVAEEEPTDKDLN